MRERYCKARERHALHIPPDQLLLPLLLLLLLLQVYYNARHWSLGMECAEGGRTKGKPTFSLLAILPLSNTVTLTSWHNPTTTVHCLYCLCNG